MVDSTTTPNQSVEAQDREAVKAHFDQPLEAHAQGYALARAAFANRTTANPSGDFVMVPREPTEAMIDAGEQMGAKTAQGVWSAMLSATPSPAKQVGGEREAIARIIAPRVWSEMDASQTFGTWWPQQKASLAKADAILAALSPTDLERMRGALLERVQQRIAIYRDMPPEEDESWESWYFASFDLLQADVARLALSQGGSEK